MPFDTSSLPDADSITAASIWVYSYGAPATGGGGTTANKSVAVVASTQASNTALATSDYSQVGSTEYATRVAASSFPNGWWQEIPLNAAGLEQINKTGYTKFALRIGYDLDNVAPVSTGCGPLLRYADYTGTTYDPYLSVTHSSTQAVGTSWTTPYSVGGDDVFMASAGTSDGEVRGGSNTSWADARAQTTGTSVDNTSTTALAGYADNNAGSIRTYFLAHGFLSFDTSALDDSLSTGSGELWVWVNTKWDTGIGATPALCLVTSTHSSPLVAADIDTVGSTELASRVALSGVSNGSWVKFTLNAAGKAAINRTGTTKLAIVSAHFLDNTTPTNTKYAGVNISYGEDADTKKPRLIVNSLAQVGAVGASCRAAYYVDSPHIMVKCEQPYLVYNFKSGTRTASGSPVTLKAAGTNTVGGPSEGWNAFPSMVRVPDTSTPFGRTLVGFWQGGGQRVDYADTSDGATLGYWNNGARFLESLDLGATWGSERVVLAPFDVDPDADSQGDGLSRFSVDPVNGDIIHVWYHNTYGGPTPGPPAVTYDGSSNKCHSWFRRSSDGGSTWTTPVRLDSYSGFPGAPNTVVAAHSCLILRDGTYLASVYGSDTLPYAAATSDGCVYTRVLKSTDRGATWSYFSTPFPKGYNYDGRANPYQIIAAETSLVELDTGRILAVARIQNAWGATLAQYWSSYSDDHGATWSTPTLAVSSITNLTAMRQTVAGDVVLAGADLTNGVRVYQSKDRGGSWSHCFTVAFASGTGVGADFIEVTGKDAENNLLLVYGEEHWRSYDYGGVIGTATIADQGWIKFQRIGSAVSDPPSVIAGSIGASCVTSYGMSGAVGRSFALPAAVTTPVGSSTAAPFSIAGVTGNSLAQPYSVIASVGASTAQPYTVGNIAGKSVAQPYSVIASVGASVTQPYTVGNIAGKSVAQPYSIVAAVGASVAQPYAVAGIVAASSTQPYVVRAYVGRRLAFPYSILDDSTRTPPYTATGTSRARHVTAGDSRPHARLTGGPTP